MTAVNMYTLQLLNKHSKFNQLFGLQTNFSFVWKSLHHVRFQ